MSSESEGFSGSLANEKTRCLEVGEPAEEQWTVQAIFEHHYDAIRAVVGRAPPGSYAVIAVHANRRLSGHAVVLSSDDIGASSLLLGRHKRAHFRLDKDPSVALRHMLIRLIVKDNKPNVRLLDLKTGQAFDVDGVGRAEAVLADGALTIRIGTYTLFFLPVGDEPWPTSASDGWQGLPETQVRDLRREVSVPAVTPYTDDQHVSRVDIIPGAADLELPEPEVKTVDAVAKLSVATRDGDIVYPLTQAQLDRGVLLGRYNRCDVGTRRIFASEEVSRVHLLIVAEGERFLAFDTASTNGTWIGGVKVAAVELGDSADIEITAGRRMTWKRLRATAAQMH